MGFVIQGLSCFIASNREGEGISGFLDDSKSPNSWVPLIGADEARVESYLPIAQVIADASGLPITLARFSKRRDVRVLTPGTPGARRHSRGAIILDASVASVPQIRVLLEAGDFERLVHGAIVAPSVNSGLSIQIALADIGFEEMLGAIWKAMG